MSGIIADSDGSSLVGTDSNHALSKPVVEVVLAGARSGTDGAPLEPDGERAKRIAAGIAKLSAARAAGGPAAAVVPKAEPAAAVDARPVEGVPPSTPDAVVTGGAKPVEVDLGGDDATPVEGEPPSADAAPADPDAPPAEEPPPEEPPAEPAPDPIAIAAHKAELEAAQQELALTRAQLEQAQLGAVSDDDRVAYVNDPLAALKGFIAQRLGVKADAREVADELAHLQRELTFEAIGLDSLPDDRKHQRSQEQTDRRWRLGQTVQAASRATAQEREQRQRIVGFVASVADAVKADFPYLALAPEIDRRPPAEVALDVWMAAVKAGRVKPTGDDQADVREALRLTNDLYKTRADKLRASIAAPPPATAPAQASPKGAAPGAPSQTPSKAPAKAGSATPKTLSAKQAAAAPVAKTTPSEKPGPVEIDPTDRDARTKRLRDIAGRHLKK